MRYYDTEGNPIEVTDKDPTLEDLKRIAREIVESSVKLSSKI